LVSNKKYLPCHNYNEDKIKNKVLKIIQDGKSISLITDAGTPLISDPGYKLVSYMQENNIRVIPIPGASAITTALSVAGIATDNFCFYGFLPSTSKTRIKKYKEIKNNYKTSIVFESCHRILDSLRDMKQVFGKNHKIVLARELTKIYEKIYRDDIQSIYEQLENNPKQNKGEFTIIINKAHTNKPPQQKVIKLLKILTEKYSYKDAAKVCASYFDMSKQECYKLALQLK
jgi:16S rRNA (cytidine1402-2'-O)-methyltransferase